MYYCLNVVTQPEGVAAAVLIRAVEPVEGVELMRKRTPSAKKDTQLTNGPGKLCRAFGITAELNGVDMCGEILFIEDRGEKVSEIVALPRVGVDYAGEWALKPLRFLEKDNPYCSKK